MGARPVTSEDRAPAKKAAPSAPVPLTPATPDELAQPPGFGAEHSVQAVLPGESGHRRGAPVDGFRSYMLNGHPAYVVVVAQGRLGQYYDLEGTTWTKPPILNNPSQTITMGGHRRCSSTSRASACASSRGDDGPAVYWLVNTLQNILTNKQMLAIAAAARPVT